MHHHSPPPPPPQVRGYGGVDGSNHGVLKPLPGLSAKSTPRGGNTTNGGSKKTLNSARERDLLPHTDYTSQLAASQTQTQTQTQFNNNNYTDGSVLLMSKSLDGGAGMGLGPVLGSVNASLAANMERTLRAMQVTPLRC